MTNEQYNSSHEPGTLTNSQPEILYTRPRKQSKKKKKFVKSSGARIICTRAHMTRGRAPAAALLCAASEFPKRERATKITRRAGALHTSAPGVARCMRNTRIPPCRRRRRAPRGGAAFDISLLFRRCIRAVVGGYFAHYI